LFICNSGVCWYFKNFLSEKLHFYPEDAKQLPIKITESKSQNEIVDIVEQIFQQKDKNLDILELENRVDELVMDLYGLNEGEKEIVRNS
jgi:mevalonate kinase